MVTMSEKNQLILQHEQHFADCLAAKVLNKPQLNIWMILIPVIFVYFMNDYQKYKNGRKAFADNYLITKKRALKEATTIVETSREPDIESLSGQAELSDEARLKFGELLTILVEHYSTLLQSEGKDYASLVRSAYKTSESYSLFVERIGNAEKALNIVLSPELKTATDGVGDVVSSMERYSEEIRNKNAQEFFA